jgi:hypothetical protein
MQRLKIKADVELTDKDRELSLVYATSIRNFIKFKYESSPHNEVTDGSQVTDDAGIPVDDRDEDCYVGFQQKCWESTISKAILSSIIGAIIVPAPTSIVIGVTLGLMKAIADIMTGQACVCNDNTGCLKPSGFNFYTDCNDPLKALVTVVGSGSAGGYWTFDLENCHRIDAQGVTINSHVTTDPYIWVIQHDVNIPCFIGVVNHCAEGKFLAKDDYNIHFLARSAGEILIFGSQSVALNQEENYYIGGSCLANASNTFTMSASFHGSVVTAAPDGKSIRIKWTVPASGSTNQWGGTGGFAASVSAQGTNTTCIGQSPGSAGSLNNIIIQ